MVERLTPEPDRIAGHNIPYRGDVDHGVPSGQIESTDEAHYHLGRPVEWQDNPKEDVEPIPVRIVRQGAREIKRVVTQIIRLPFGNPPAPVQLCGRDEKRVSITIHNAGSSSNSANDRVIVGNADVSAFTGHIIPWGGSLTLNTTEPLWILNPSGNPPGGTGGLGSSAGNDIIVSTIIEVAEREG
jgi:hypothetical protein